MLSPNTMPISRRRILERVLETYYQKVVRVPAAYASYMPLAEPLNQMMRDILDSTLLYEDSDHVMGCLSVYDTHDDSDMLWPGSGIIHLQWAEQRNVVTSVWRKRHDVTLPLELAGLQIVREYDELQTYSAVDLAPPAYASAPLNQRSTNASASISKAMQTLLNTLVTLGYTATPGHDHSDTFAAYCLRKTGYPTVLMGFYLEHINAF